ncbi:MAG: (2Fe-2S)-binding protein [Proteobacteria bacterium]|nr:(2Fe-2S)-binding protein [Pseudomonadota bacterium]
MTPRPAAKPKYVCECLKVTEAAILRAIDQQKVREMKELIDRTSAGDGCTACHPALQEYLARTGAPCASASTSLPPSPSARRDSFPSLPL